jgi:type IV secretion system protein VirB10
VAIRAKPPSPRRLSRAVLLAGATIVGGVMVLALVTGLAPRAPRTQALSVGVAASGPPESILEAAREYDPASLGGGYRSEAEFPAVAPPSDLEPPRDPYWAGATMGDPAISPGTGLAGSGLAGPGASGTGRSLRQGAGAPPADAGASQPMQRTSHGESDPESMARGSAILFPRGSGGDARVGAPARSGPDRLASRLAPPAGRYVVQAGQVVPAALLTALNSEQPGRVVAQVTAPVFDSVTGEEVLIPAGSRLIGRYDAETTYGDARLVVTWNRLILPNGWSLDLEAMPGADGVGSAGLRDRVDNRLGRLAGAVAMSAVMSVIAQGAQDRGRGRGEDRGDLRGDGRGDGGDVADSLADAAALQAAETGARIVDRDLALRPVMRVRAGAPVRVLVTQDMVLRPYRGAT